MSGGCPYRIPFGRRVHTFSSSSEDGYALRTDNCDR